MQAAGLVLALVCGMTSMVLFAGASFAQDQGEPEPGTVVHVAGGGTTTFAEPAEPTPSDAVACTFAVDLLGYPSGADAASGTYTCELSPQAQATGLPFASLVMEAATLRLAEDGTAEAGGTAVLTLADGTQIPDVPAVLVSTAGGPAIGGFGLKLFGVFDGQPGDVEPGDGDYTSAPQIVLEGLIEIEVLPLPTPTVTQTPSPTGSPSPSPTATPSPTPTGSPSPVPTQSPSPTPKPSTSPTHSPTPAATTPVAGGGSPPALAPEPPGAGSTARLMSLLVRLSGTDPPKLADVLSVVGPFPVAGLSWWQNDWHAYRCCPTPHQHQGLDMFAAQGTPVVAAADGVISQKVIGPVSGLGLEVTDAGGTQYFYAHLSRFADVAVGRTVKVGQVIGYVGHTGNAWLTSPHLHFEIQPGGIPTAPRPMVDAWLARAEARARALLADRGIVDVTPDTVLPGVQRRVDDLAAGGSDPALGREGLGGPAVRPTRPASSSRKVAGGAMMAFAAGAFLLLVMAPGIAQGRREGGPRDP